MKFALFLLAALCASTQGFKLTDEMMERANSEIARFISQAFIERLEDRVIRGFRETEVEPRITAIIIGPGQEPTILPNLDLPLIYDIAISEAIKINSTGSLHYETPTVSGLSKVQDLLNVSIVPTTLTWDFSLPTVSIEGTYILEQFVEADFLFEVGKEGFHEVMGAGQLKASVDDVFLNLAATVKSAGFLEIRELSLDLGFKNLLATGDGTTLDGQSVDLAAALIPKLELVFNSLIWTEENKVIITDAIKESVNKVIGNCQLADFLGGSFECLMPTTPTSPTTVVSTSPTTVVSTSPTTVVSTSPTTVVSTSPTTVVSTSPVTESSSEATTEGEENHSANVTGLQGVILVMIAVMSRLFS